MDLSNMGGINVLNSFSPSTSGAANVDPDAPVKTIAPTAGQQTAVTFGAGVSTQELNDALDPSGLLAIGAAYGKLLILYSTEYIRFRHSGVVSVTGGYGQTAGHGSCQANTALQPVTSSSSKRLLQMVICWS
jgi:hypothetical protein